MLPETGSFIAPGEHEKIMNMIFIKIVLFLIEKNHYEDLMVCFTQWDNKKFI